jgi:hypothetical protein
MNELHLPSYKAATKELSSMFRLPEWDNEGRGLDVPDLPVHFSVKPIAYNPLFPPLCRVKAYQSILIEDLPAQVGKWRRWLRRVAAGKVNDYVLQLHAHHFTDFMRYHWSYLRSLAFASLSSRAIWAQTQDLRKVRNAILALPEPYVFEVSAMPGRAGRRTSDKLDPHAYRELLRDLRTLMRLTDDWNTLATKNFRIPNYNEDYDLTIEQFKDRNANGWVEDLLNWCDACAKQGFSLFLDYWP